MQKRREDQSFPHGQGATAKAEGVTGDGEYEFEGAGTLRVGTGGRTLREQGNHHLQRAQAAREEEAGAAQAHDRQELKLICFAYS